MPIGDKQQLGALRLALRRYRKVQGFDQHRRQVGQAKANFVRQGVVQKQRQMGIADRVRDLQGVTQMPRVIGGRHTGPPLQQRQLAAARRFASGPRASVPLRGVLGHRRRRAFTGSPRSRY